MEYSITIKGNEQMKISINTNGIENMGKSTIFEYTVSDITRSAGKHDSYQI